MRISQRFDVRAFFRKAYEFILVPEEVLLAEKFPLKDARAFPAQSF